jgi:thiamine-monophosphate kinase
VDEFALIRHFFAGLTAARRDVVLGIGDDAALLAVPAGYTLAVTTDTLIAGRHFPEAATAFDIGYKSLAVNLSDLAAMAAAPRWVTLALTLPAVEPQWLQGFAAGFKTLADAEGVALVGGDTTRGPLAISVTAMGVVETGTALRRQGARSGDCIAVTGTLGDAALGLRLSQDPSPMPTRESSLAGEVRAAGLDRHASGNDALFLLGRLHQPQPRNAAGRALRGLASACIDVSDGLAGDLGHILAASGCGAEIDAACLPRSAAFTACAPVDALSLQLHGGDDYELCLTLPPQHLAAAQSALAALGVPLTLIGHCTAEPGLRLRHNGALRPVAASGYNHFSVP